MSINPTCLSPQLGDWTSFKTSRYSLHALCPNLLRCLTKLMHFYVSHESRLDIIPVEWIVTEQPLRKPGKNSDPLIWNSTPSFFCLQFLASYSFEFHKLYGIFASLDYFLLRAPECPNSWVTSLGVAILCLVPESGTSQSLLASQHLLSSSRISLLCL